MSEATATSDAVFIVNTAPEDATRDSVTAADLPASISTYLSTNYSGYTLKKAFKVSLNGSLDSYIVVIFYNGKPVGLKFDAEGNFVRVFEQRERGDLRGRGWKRGGRFDGRDGQHRDTIALSSLSAAITTYFQLTYPTDTLLHAFVNKDGSTVVVSTNNGLYATAFSSTGVFLKRAQIFPHQGRKTMVAEADLPAAISAYLSTSYPGYVFDRAFAIKSNNVVLAYVVLINANNTRYALEFNAAGTFVRNAVIH